MENCAHHDIEDCEVYKKIPLCGSIHTYCEKKTVIYESSVFESFGMISFTNQGQCTVEVFKNKDKAPMAAIRPGDSFTFAANPLSKIAIKCKACTEDHECETCKNPHTDIRNECESIEKCKLDNAWNQAFCKNKKHYEYHTPTDCEPCCDSEPCCESELSCHNELCCCNDILCFEGFVCVIFVCDTDCDCIC